MTQMATEYAFNPQDTLSALADGQLRGEAFAQAVEQVESQAEAQATNDAAKAASQRVLALENAVRALTNMLGAS